MMLRVPLAVPVAVGAALLLLVGCAPRTAGPAHVAEPIVAETVEPSPAPSPAPSPSAPDADAWDGVTVVPATVTDEETLTFSFPEDEGRGYYWELFRWDGYRWEPRFFAVSDRGAGGPVTVGVGEYRWAVLDVRVAYDGTDSLVFPASAEAGRWRACVYEDERRCVQFDVAR